MNQQIQRLNHVAGASLRLFGRALTSTGAWATPTNISSVAVSVKKPGSAPSHSGAPSMASCLYDTLQTTDAAWTDDFNDARTPRGYNFAYTVPASAFPSSGWYTIQVTLNETGGGVTKMLYEGAVRGTL